MENSSVGVADRAVVPEISPSPRMLECGFRVLAASGITDDPLEADKLLVERIWLAMEACRLQESEFPAPEAPSS